MLSPETVFDIWCSITGGGLRPESRERFLAQRQLLRRIGAGDPEVVIRTAEELYAKAGELRLAAWAGKVPKAIQPTYDPAGARMRAPRSQPTGKTDSRFARPRDTGLHRQISDRLNQRQDYL